MSPHEEAIDSIIEQLKIEFPNPHKVARTGFKLPSAVPDMVVSLHSGKFIICEVGTTTAFKIRLYLRIPEVVEVRWYDIESKECVAKIEGHKKTSFDDGLWGKETDLPCAACHQLTSVHELYKVKFGRDGATYFCEQCKDKFPYGISSRSSRTWAEQIFLELQSLHNEEEISGNHPLMDTLFNQWIMKLWKNKKPNTQYLLDTTKQVGEELKKLDLLVKELSNYSMIEGEKEMADSIEYQYTALGLTKVN